MKVTVMLEELLAAGHSGAEYDAWLIHDPAATSSAAASSTVNPNSKIPALMDRSGPKPIRVFESGAILLHLAEKFGAFLPDRAGQARRMPVVAVLADGQRALSRRRLRPLLRLCADQDRIRHRPLRHGGEAPARRARPAAGRGRISWPATTTPSPTWRSGPGTAAWPRACSTAAASSCRCRSYKNLQRWTDQIAERPAVKRGRMVNCAWGDPAGQLRERHDASDFELRTQDKLEPAS